LCGFAKDVEADASASPVESSSVCVARFSPATASEQKAKKRETPKWERNESIAECLNWSNLGRTAGHSQIGEYAKNNELLLFLGFFKWEFKGVLF
jgi:hypothetical protein